jgi:nucleoside-diphosphate-sugar epimerase
MKTLVTGANGFTGSYLVKLLLKKGYKVKGVVRKTSDLEAIKNLPVELYYADLASHASFDDAMADIDIVYNVGAAYRVEGVPQKYFWDVNVEGTRKLLEAAKKKGVKKFVHCSTVGVQGDIKNPPATEEYPYGPGDYYQESKVEGEKLALKYFKEGLPLTVVRPVGIYGPGDLRFLKLFNFINDGKFRMIGSGNVLYHLTYVEDLAEGIFLAGEKEEALGEIFTIGGEEYLILSELVEKIAKALDKPLPDKMSVPVWPVWFAGLLCEVACKPFGVSPPIYRRRVDFFIKDRAFDISKAKKLLGYIPKVSLDKGLKITAEWYKEKGLIN